MKYFKNLFAASLSLTLQSCQASLTDFATEWTRDIKQKIIEDASQQSTRTVFDSARNEITIFKGDKKLKYFYFKPSRDSLGKHLFKDTAVTVFFSSDQNFELVRELCPVVERSFEGVKYKGEFLGLAEFKYCNGKLKKSGFRLGEDIGVWKEFDLDAKVIKEIDKGNLDRLEELKKLKYYR